MVVSDHAPLLLSCHHFTPTKKIMRLETFWLRYEEVYSLVQFAWDTHQRGRPEEEVGLKMEMVAAWR
jgi:hypothetical protein